MKLYAYVGPAHLAKHATSDTPRLRVESGAALAAWLVKQPGTGADGALTVTFVVLPDGLWVADRHSEHVACARGGPVYSAGEMTFAVDRRRQSVEVVYVTNQSAGFCPEPGSWPAVAAALDAAGIGHPGGFNAAMIFRRCPACGATNIVKDGWFECAVCGGELPREWNYDSTVPAWPSAGAKRAGSTPMNVRVSDDIRSVVEWELRHGNEVDRVVYPGGAPAVMMRRPVRRWVGGALRDVPPTCAWREFRDPHFAESEWCAGFESVESGYQVGGLLTY